MIIEVAILTITLVIKPVAQTSLIFSSSPLPSALENWLANPIVINNVKALIITVIGAEIETAALIKSLILNGGIFRLFDAVKYS